MIPRFLVPDSTVDLLFMMLVFSVVLLVALYLVVELVEALPDLVREGRSWFTADDESKEREKLNRVVEFGPRRWH